MKQQIVSFETLFPLLRNSEIYVIEDLHASYWASFGFLANTQNPKASTIHV